MKYLTIFVSIALVAVTFGKTQDWVLSDDSIEADATMFAGLDDANMDDIIKDVDMDSLVDGVQTGSIEDSVDMDSLEQSLAAGACACKGHKCACCFNRRYRVLWKKYNINVCVSVSWAGSKFYFRMTFSGAVVYRSFVTRDLTVCKRFPRTVTAKACVKLYRVNLSRRSFCINMYDRSWRRHVNHVNKCFRFVGDNGIAEPSKRLE